MIEFTYLLIGSIIFYGTFTLAVEILREIRNKKHELADVRDTDERQIAGEETSEVALDYLQLAKRPGSPRETR
jgi:hypothetical protein|tara:strand:+ start:71 stop:289 length:219 start_codon:yes stop_codon:yes gene_type:complete